MPPLLSYFVVMATTFIAVLKSTCNDNLPVSQIFYSLFQYGYLISFQLEMGSLYGNEDIQNGIVARVRVRTRREGSQLCYIGA